VILWLNRVELHFQCLASAADRNLQFTDERSILQRNNEQSIHSQLHRPNW